MFEIDIQLLPFLMLFGLGIALFHTLILTELFKLKLKPGWILFIIDPLIIALGFFLFPKQSGFIFIGLFASVFVLGIIAFIRHGIQGIVDSFREAKKDKKPLWKVVASGLAIVFFFLCFLFLGIYSFFIVIFLVIITSILPSNKNRFYFYQRNLSTSKIKSVAMGLAEICGKAKAITKAVSPHTSTQCVAYIYTIDEITEKTDDDGRTDKSYREIKREINAKNFLLQDESGSIEIQTDKLEWINFSPSFETETGSRRYREYILDEKTEILMIGQAFYEGSNTIFRYDETKKLFGMAPLEIVNFANKWRPLKLRAVTTLLCIALISAFIFITPMRAEGSRLIFESINLKERFSKNPLEMFNDFFK
ncbi:hypothetical protein VUJ46_11415 [Chryseobacterium sp. MYb264]|uniref:hypothetical protein n=1 Tax=Chryseobacterium sp. MYb264 TaxID=2745153 RepID=UPI002E163B27|nr:hypothetical protein VUJ46_11415 [Chryseobacterium sp. MYb264]